jgi:hypothetical protein
MRVNATVKGSLEQYIKEQVSEKGMTAAVSLVELAYAGMEYKMAMSKMPEVIQALTQLEKMSNAQMTIPE